MIGECWQRLDKERAPGAPPLELWYCAKRETHEIRLHGGTLMASDDTASERALARAAVAALRPDRRESVRMLIGGLGLGFTLVEALAQVGSRAMLTVADLSPKTLEWTARLHPTARADARWRFHAGDVRSELTAQWDLIALDLDNGLGELSRPENAWFYALEGLGALWQSIAPEGALAVWTTGPEPRLVERCAAVGFRPAQAQDGCLTICVRPK